MTPDMLERLERHRKALYLAVKNNRPDLYERVVQVGHLALPDFGGRDDNKRAATVEHSVMALVAEAAGIDVPLPGASEEGGKR